MFLVKLSTEAKKLLNLSVEVAYKENNTVFIYILEMAEEYDTIAMKMKELVHLKESNHLTDKFKIFIILMYLSFIS
jgi:hypothetical protein